MRTICEDIRTGERFFAEPDEFNVPINLEMRKKIDPDDPYVKELIDEALKEQEKLRELQKIDPDIGNLFVGNL
jgi:hypothetical protein